MNRSFYKGPNHLQPNGGHAPCQVWVVLTAAADYATNGATITEGDEVVSSVARTGEGIITLTLKDQWAGLLEFSGSIENADGAYGEVELDSHTVTASTKTVVVHTRTNAAPGVLSDIPDSGVLRIKLTLKV